MGVGLITGQDDLTALYCTTDMVAFGPLFETDEAAQDFLTWLPEDPRRYETEALTAKYDEWHDLAYDAGGYFSGRTTNQPSSMPTSGPT